MLKKSKIFLGKFQWLIIIYVKCYEILKKFRKKSKKIQKKF